MSPVDVRFATFRGRTTECPTCRKVHKAQTVADGSTPRAPVPGDLTICIGCTALLTFLPDLSLRLISDQEFRALPYSLQQSVRTAQQNLKAARLASES